MPSHADLFELIGGRIEFKWINKRLADGWWCSAVQQNMRIGFGHRDETAGLCGYRLSAIEDRGGGGDYYSKS